MAVEDIFWAAVEKAPVDRAAYLDEACGGTTRTGRPCLVMDLVKGVPITRYCDEHHLTPRQRLELFVMDG
jgi:hypothetical protein